MLPGAGLGARKGAGYDGRGVSDQRSAISVAWRALACVQVLACLCVLTVTQSAQAAPGIKWVTQGPDCDLPYNPYTHETATQNAGVSYVGNYSYLCSLDEDHDGLDDRIENKIAKCFAPYVIFDSRENARDKRPELPKVSPPDSPPIHSEPLALYMVEPVKPAGDHIHRISLQWVLVFDNDGGFEKLEGLAQGHANSHPGDSQWIDMRVQVSQKADGSWYARLEKVHPTDAFWQEQPIGAKIPPDDDQIACGPRQSLAQVLGWSGSVLETLYFGAGCSPNPVQVGHLEVFGSTHPVVYLSAGKHHSFPHAQSEYPWFDFILGGAAEPLFAQYDRADGKGRQFVVATQSDSGQTLNVGRSRGDPGLFRQPWLQLRDCRRREERLSRGVPVHW